MSYSILRVAKVKGFNNTRGIQKHCQRENKNYRNKDINPYDTHLNYDLINGSNIDFKQKIDSTIDANYTGGRKIRSDAIRHVDGLITSDEEFFKNLDEDETEQFFKESLAFLEDEYGKENMLYATVHLDEKVPHMHFGFVPLTGDGRLSAKEKLGNKKAMMNLQDRFNGYVNAKGYELERGTSKELTEKQHRQMDRYKTDTLYHKSEYELAKDEHEQIEEKLKHLKEQLSNDVKRLNKSEGFNFEDEKHIEKSFFGKVVDEQATGRKIISAEDYSRIQDRLLSATRILNDYETLTNQDIYKENENLKKERDAQNKRAQEWMNESFKHETRVYDLKKKTRN
ncbi:MobV family relaxase [Salinicoccus sp. CNSTN-B1]